MKKLLVLGLMLMAGNANALSFKDNIQNWRTLETSTAAKYVLLTTGCPCYVYDLTVTSGLAIQNPTFQYYWSTVTINMNPGDSALDNQNLSISTSTTFNTATAGNRFLIEEIVTSNSIFYTKTSSSSIKLKWDYWNTAPPGNYSSNGRNPQRKQ